MSDVVEPQATGIQSLIATAERILRQKHNNALRNDHVESIDADGRQNSIWRVYLRDFCPTLPFSLIIKQYPAEGFIFQSPRQSPYNTLRNSLFFHVE